MSCFLQEEKGRRVAVFVFRRDILMYDIENYAWIEGSVMPKETEAHVRQMVQDIGDEGNVDRANRVLDLCHAKAKEALYPFTKHEVKTAEIENLLREPAVYGIVLSVPDDFSQTTLSLLERLIHEYMVCKAVEEWLSITYPARQETWRMKAEEARQEIRVYLGSRMNRGRRRLHPF